MIWDLIKGSIDLIVAGINGIVNFVTDFFVNLLELIKFIFVPGDNFFVDSFNELKTSFADKLNIDLSVIENLGTANEVNPIKDIDFEIMGTKVSLDLRFLESARKYTLALGSGLTAIFLCYFHSRKIIWLVRGGGGQDE